VIVDLLDRFYEAGGRAIDLANSYSDGASQRAVGRWLRARRRRDDVVLFAKGCHPPRTDPRLVPEEVEIALRSLGADRLDVFILHRDDLGLPVDAWAEPLAEQLRRGTVERVGVSNWTAERFRALRELLSGDQGDRLVVLSNHFSLAEMGEPPWPGCLAIDAVGARSLADSGITVLAWSSLAHGYLTDRGATDPAIEQSWKTPENERRRERAASLAAELDTSTATIAVAYVLAHDGIRPVVGTRSAEHLAEVLAGETIDLTPDQLAHLESGTPT
jgi:aryl-alcohol dehydrogenase-like predicted oxidoreductase